MSISYFAECTVLITGASAGIGREFARQLAPVVNTMVLVARRNDRLEALELELKIVNPRLEVFCRQLDLRDQIELERFCDWLDESDLSVDLLVNNAGLGDRGAFIDGEWARHQAMLQVNIAALTYLTYRILPSMRKTGCGAILNVSSAAGFLPMPNFAVYAATKAYVTSFSEALRAEFRNSNISVTALCPGPVPTEFGDIASRMPQGYISPMPDLFTVSVQEVVRTALHAVSRDQARVIPGTLVNLAMTTLVFVPMFLQRLVLNAQAARDTASSSPATPRDYEISGMV
jgi:short-subunit dehydrogenase